MIPFLSSANPFESELQLCVDAGVLELHYTGKQCWNVEDQIRWP